jgi:hypothetical protein
MPLTRLLKSDTGQLVKNMWTPECFDAFHGIKLALTSAPVLALPDPNKHYTVVSDACVNGLGAVLLQDGHPIAYESRKTSPAESRYTTEELEMLGVVHALTVWRCYLEGPVFTVVTDHNPLVYFDTKKLLSRRQARWQEFLSRFTFQWKYIKGRENMADPLSRMPHLVALAAMLAPVTRGAERAQRAHDDVLLAAQADDAFKDFFDRCRAGYDRDPWFAHLEHTASLSSKNGIWYHLGRVVIPDHIGLRDECLASVHDAPYSGHFGIDRTLHQAKRLFFWPTLAADVTAYVKSCASCQRNKPLNRKPAGLLRPLEIPGRRWESISMDLITCLPKTDRGHDTSKFQSDLHDPPIVLIASYLHDWQREN